MSVASGKTYRTGDLVAYLVYTRAMLSVNMMLSVSVMNNGLGVNRA